MVDLHGCNGIMFSKALWCTWGQMLSMLNLISYATSSNAIQLVKYYKNDMMVLL
jgi:hypothetical protein